MGECAPQDVHAPVSPTVNKIAIHNKMNKHFKTHSNSKFTSSSSPLEKLFIVKMDLAKQKGKLRPHYY